MAALGRGTGQISPSGIARALYAQAQGRVPGATLAAYLAVTNRALRAAGTVESMRASQDYVPRLSEIPVNPMLTIAPERIHYNVVVRIQDASGITQRYGGVVTTNTPLSEREVIDRVLARIDFRVSPTRAARDALARVGSTDILLGAEITSLRRVS
jgi:hypothetical protein